MATPFPPTRNTTSSSRLFPYSIAATLLVIGLPFAAVMLVDQAMGFDEVPPLLLAVVSIMCAVASSALGMALWMQHPASNEVSFGDLMIWSWARSAQARRKLVRSFHRLSDGSEVLSPHERLAILKEMSKGLERKDPYTYGHSRRVERLAHRTGLTLELPPHDLEVLREAASIHDVGKIYVPDAILLKPGRLTADEYTTIKAHAVMGAEMVAFLDRPELTDTVRFHHERWDGEGYPDGVAGEDIPLLARVVGTVDAYDAMTSMRSYRGSLGHKRAVEILVEGKGKQFDANVVTAFLTTLRNPMLAALSIPLLGGPIDALRRALGWMGRSARSDLATAAGALGMTVAITSSLGAAGDISPPVAVNRHAAIGQEAPGINGGSISGHWNDAGRADEGPDTNAGRASKAGGGTGNGGGRGRDGESRSGSDPGGGSAPTATDGTASGESGITAASGPDPAGAAAGAGDPAPQNVDPSAPESEAVRDPNLGKGKDCAGGGSGSVGSQMHCKK